MRSGMIAVPNCDIGFVLGSRVFEPARVASVYSRGAQG